jgi:hypothetical protein
MLALSGSPTGVRVGVKTAGDVFLSPGTTVTEVTLSPARRLARLRLLISIVERCGR